MKIVLTESAADDIAEGYLFYQGQAPGLGDYFESAIFTDIRSLVIYAGVHEVHFGRYFRKITRHFPHAIYYTVEDEVILVHAILDTRRDTNLIERKIDRD
ncbi:MAG: type II toxin-antitoxin system RelE/ParE family toxin [Pyrinomonadaceae bacterium]